MAHPLNRVMAMMPVFDEGLQRRFRPSQTFAVLLCSLLAGCGGRTVLGRVSPPDEGLAEEGGGAAQPTCAGESTVLAVLGKGLRGMAQDQDTIYVVGTGAEDGVADLVRIDKQSGERAEVDLPFIPKAVTVDGEYLYLQDSHYDSGWRSSIYRLRKGDSAPEVLWRDGLDVRGLAARGGAVFFIDNGALRASSPRSPNVFAVVEDHASSFVVDDDFVFILWEDDVVRRARPVDERRVIAVGVSGSLIGIVSGYVYVVAKAEFSLGRIPVQGGSVEAVAPLDGLLDAPPYSVAVDTTAIYFADYRGALYHVDPSGTLPQTPKLAVRGDHYDDDDFEAVVLADSRYVYWLTGASQEGCADADGCVDLVKSCRVD